MKHSLLMLFLIYASNTLCMELVPVGRTLKTQSSTVAVAVEIPEESLQLVRMPVPEWKEEVALAVRDCKSTRLIQLLSPEGRPAPTRGRFIPYTNALEQIKAHKEREERILTNTAEPDAKCCKCCNATYVWNRAIAPAILVLVALGQVGFSAASLAAAIHNYQTQNSTTFSDIVTLVAPVGGLISGLGGLPFSLFNAYRRFILKDEQSKYEYYVIAEHNVETHDNMERLLLENKQALQELLARDPNPHTRAGNLLKRLKQLSEQPEEEDGGVQGQHSNNVDLDVIDL